MNLNINQIFKKIKLTLYLSFSCPIKLKRTFPIPIPKKQPLILYIITNNNETLVKKS